MKWTSDDIKLVEKFIDIKNRGMYCDGAQLTNAYNRILEKSVNVTSCGSCLRQRVQELEDALNRFKKLQELEKKEEVNDTKEEENKVLTEAKNEVISSTLSASEMMKQRMAKVRSARGKKK